MPNWIYQQPFPLIAFLLITVSVLCSLVGLYLTRSLVLPRLRFHDGVNDAVGGAVQAIGVFYGVTVGLIAIGVWTSYGNARDIVSREAVAAYTLHNNISSLPDPPRTRLRDLVRCYVDVIVNDWPKQKDGDEIGPEDAGHITEIRRIMGVTEPATDGEKVRYSAAVQALNRLVEQRRLRIDANDTRIAGVMWSVILIGAAISIGIAYLFRIEDARLHGAIVTLMSAFLGLVLFMIVINDRPFLGSGLIQSSSYEFVAKAMWDDCCGIESPAAVAPGDCDG
jgi:hypothetical protein